MEWGPSVRKARVGWAANTGSFCTRAYFRRICSFGQVNIQFNDTTKRWSFQTERQIRGLTCTTVERMPISPYMCIALRFTSSLKFRTDIRCPVVKFYLSANRAMRNVVGVFIRAPAATSACFSLLI